ncbi:unnamed protein product [Mucor hiemalis]
MKDDKSVPAYAKKYIDNIRKEQLHQFNPRPNVLFTLSQQQQEQEPSVKAPQSLHQQKRQAPDSSEDAHQKKRSHVIEEDSSAATDESVADTNMADALDHFLNGSNFSKFHQNGYGTATIELPIK